MRRAYILFAFGILVSITYGQLPAFPGAEGFGKFAAGGRFGKVYEVTNLNDNGPGSLRAAIGKKGARTIVFKVSGTIKLLSTLRITKDSVYIAGQTAPGDGICIADNSVYINARHVIVRYIRVRCGDINPEVNGDSFGGKGCDNVIIDHCSISWSIDETASFYDNTNFTMQWCIISESLYGSHHPKGHHGFGGIWGGTKASYHHNLLAHHSSRNPRFSGSETTVRANDVDFRNNTIYNWGYNSVYGGEGGTFNIVDNYYKPGPATQKKVLNRILEVTDEFARWYINGNYVCGDSLASSDNWKYGVQGKYCNASGIKVDSPFNSCGISAEDAYAAYLKVLSDAGANYPKRDVIDNRIITEVKTGIAECGGDSYRKDKKSMGIKTGIIDSQTEAGGWPELKSAPAPTDTDHDGMPDEWEINKGLNPTNPDDRNKTDETGYTMLEIYLNTMVSSGM